MASLPQDLVRLAELQGIQLAYEDVDGERVEADAESLLAVLRALGVAIDDPADAGREIARVRRSRWGRPLEPVVAGFGGYLRVALRLAEHRAVGEAGMHLTLEGGEVHTWKVDLARAERLGAEEVGGERYVALGLPVTDLPYGYHRLAVDVDGARHETLLIVAPHRAWQGQRGREWGALVPLYALRTDRDRGIGDLTDLSELAAWLDELGGSVVGTLPLLPVFLGDENEPFDPSPYSPVSRLFWNELYLDLSRSPELDRSGRASELLATSHRAHDGRYVDYEQVASAHGRALRALSDTYFADPGDRRGDLERLIERRPEVERYALFRGAVARYGARWWEWPEPQRDGDLDLGNVDLAAARHHLYAQLLADQQVAELSDELRRAGQHPYLDLPVGTRRDGFDVFEHRDAFAIDADTGAPPDTIFTGGQNWRIPPLHPRGQREDGYRYLREVLRHNLELADDLRIDHVMGLHRLFWIPSDVDARDGVYVRYPAHELYAVLNLESHRHRSRIVGENLGTVPKEVEDALRDRGTARMFVLQYQLHPDGEPVLPDVPGDVVASVNTHDMPPFAAWWRGLDADDSVDLGLMDEVEANETRAGRARLVGRLGTVLAAQGRLAPSGTEDPAEVHAALLEWLGETDAPVVLANLEDLWLEDEPQNTPGTDTERPNWRRRTALRLDAFRQRRDVTGPLRRLDRAREGRRNNDG